VSNARKGTHRQWSGCAASTRGGGESNEDTTSTYTRRCRDRGRSRRWRCRRRQCGDRQRCFCDDRFVRICIGCGGCAKRLDDHFPQWIIDRNSARGLVDATGAARFGGQGAVAWFVELSPYGNRIFDRFIGPHQTTITAIQLPVDAGGCVVSRSPIDAVDEAVGRIDRPR
jgi:hypothetical protein